MPRLESPAPRGEAHPPPVAAGQPTHPPPRPSERITDPPGWLRLASTAAQTCRGGPAAPSCCDFGGEDSLCALHGWCSPGWRSGGEGGGQRARGHQRAGWGSFQSAVTLSSRGGRLTRPPPPPFSTCAIMLGSLSSLVSPPQSCREGGYTPEQELGWGEGGGMGPVSHAHAQLGGCCPFVGVLKGQEGSRP